jgi:beta-N-acetylhexosaminidase
MHRRLPVVAVAVAVAAVGVTAGPANARLLQSTRATPLTLATAAYDRMTPAERVGQLFMTAMPTTGASAAQITALRAQSVDNVILVDGTSISRSAVHDGTWALATHLTEAGVAPFISTDQEGGEVQRLTGDGFAAIPTALAQGKLRAAALRSASTTWGRQLLAAGVNLDLAPVADVVPAKHALKNQPIGQYKREYGHTPGVVATHVVAFARGMAAAGVDATLKHFPGLGRATGNTDTTPGVTDPTTRHDPYLEPFTDGVKAAVPFVMVSSATYPKIDATHLACFSKTIITGMLRGDLHFNGVVISDDLGTVAMAQFPIATRAINFFNAGGTMLLDTSIGQIPTMVRAVTAKAATDTAFAKVIKAAEMNVLVAKASAQLIKG